MKKDNSSAKRENHRKKLSNYRDDQKTNIDNKEKQKNKSVLYLNENLSKASTPRSDEAIKKIQPQQNLQKKTLTKKIIIIIASVILIAIIISVVVFFLTKKQKSNQEVGDEEKNSDESEIGPNQSNEEEISPKTIENPKVKRIKMSKISNDNVSIEGINKELSSYRTNIYDISKYIEYGSGKENGISYSKKYTYMILLLKQCLSVENEIDECEIDENDISSSNLRYLDNSQEKKLCLFNMTDNNNILSIKCPKFLDISIKSIFINDLDYLTLFLGEEEKNGISEKKITSCGQNCLIEKEIITNNGESYEEVCWKNKTNSSKDTLKTKITIKMEQTTVEKKEIMEVKNIDFDKTENMISSTADINANCNDNGNNFDIDNEGNFNDVILFDRTFLDFKIALKNRIENNEGNLKASLIMSIKNLKERFEYLSNSLDLSAIKETKSHIAYVNNIGNELEQNIKNALEILTDTISQYFNSIITSIQTTNLEDIIQSINDKKSDIQNFKNEIDNVMTKLDEISSQISSDINIYTGQINSNINGYTTEYINLIEQISTNIENLKNLLNSQENISTKISNYYLNDTSTSFVGIIQKAKDIFLNYYKYEKDLIDKEIKIFTENFEKNIEIKNEISNLYEFKNYFNYENGDDINNKINSINTAINNIIIKVKEEIENKKSIKENGYYITDTVINSNKDKYNNVINDALNTVSELNNLDFIDKKFDKTIIEFKENYTKLLQYLDEQKDNQFPLSENVLKDGFFSEDEEQKIKNDIQSLVDNIINDIKEKHNTYYNNILETIETLNNSKDKLNSYIYDLNILCANESLDELAQSFESTFKIYLNNIKEGMQKSVENYMKYLNNDTKILEQLNIKADTNEKVISKQITNKFLNIINIKKYINNQLNNDLSEEFSDIMNKIMDILISIKNNQLNSEYEQLNDLNFINENINIVDTLYDRISLFFSNNIFNNKYKKMINEIVSSINNAINEKYNNINALSTTIECPDSYIFIKLGSGESHCINIFDESSDYVNFNFPQLSNDNNFKVFKAKLDKYYSSLNTSMNSYNSKIESFLSSLKEVEEQKSEINLDLDSIENKINSILSKKFGSQLVNNCYNYYKSNTVNKIESILNEFLNRINNTFNAYAIEISDNIPNYKYGINELKYFASIYNNIITQNITKNFYDSLIDNQKNNFNYTLSYYYNRFINLVNSSYRNILNNLPKNKNELNAYIDESKQLIDNKFKSIFNKIEQSKNESLNINYQVFYISVARTNFFTTNKLLSDNILITKNLLDEKQNEIYSSKGNSETALIAKLYLENSHNAKLLEDFYKPVYNNSFIVLNKEKFKDLIIDNIAFDKNEFINKMNDFLYGLNNEKEFLKLKNKYIQIWEDEIKLYFNNENKNGIFDNINKLYNNDFKFNDNQIKDINKNINEIINKIIQSLSDEKTRIEKEETSYNMNYAKIEETLKGYKIEIINKIENKIKDIVNDFKENIYQKIFTNKVEIDLNNYMEEVKKYTKDYGEKKLLDSSYNIGNIIDGIVENLIIKYKEMTKMEINYKYQIKLIDIINMDDIKKLINDRIDNEYNNNLLPTLKKYSSNTISTEYDFSSAIKNNLQSTITTKISNIENIITSLKNNYNIEDNDLSNLNINTINEKLSNIATDFNNFISSSTEYENTELNEKVKYIIISNFNTSFNNVITLFGKLFLERYMKHNELFKIQGLYNNVKYTFVQLLIYYQILYSFKNENYMLPNDLINKIHNLNYIDTTVENKKIDILAKIKEQIDNFSNIKEDIIQKFINDIKGDTTLTLNFSGEMKQKLVEYINEININDFDEQYNKIINDCLEENINKVYYKIFNQYTNEVLELINTQKTSIKSIIPLNTNEVKNEELENINKKIDEVLDSIDKFKQKNITFKLPDDLCSGMSKNYNDKISLQVQNLIALINNAKNDIKTEIENRFKSLTNSLVVKEFDSSNIENSINIIISNINSYSNKLKKKFMRYLEDKLIGDDDETVLEVLNQNKEGIIIQKLLDISNRNKLFINSFEIGEKIDDYLNNFDNSYKTSINLVKTGKFQEDIKDLITNKLLQTNEIYVNYMKKINQTLYNTKNNFNTSIFKINNLLNNENQNELKYLQDSLTELNNNVKSLMNSNKEKFTSINNNNSYIIDNYIINTKIIYNDSNSFDLKIEEDYDIYNPKIFANLKKPVKPIKFEIEMINERYNASLIIDFLNKDNLNMNKYIFTIQAIDDDSGNASKDCKTRNFEQKSNELILLN